MAKTNSISTSTILNITKFLSIKLDQYNYLLWLSQFLPVLHSYDLLGIVDGSEPCPPQFIPTSADNPTPKLNPEFVLWIKKD